MSEVRERDYWIAAAVIGSGVAAFLLTSFFLGRAYVYALIDGGRRS